MTKRIPLSQGQVALVSDWRYEELSQWKWSAQWSEKTQSYYAVRRAGKRPHRKGVLMHRQIMNTPKGTLCDHINHDTLDNQDYNLRNVTSSQNNMNRGAKSKNKLGEKCIIPYRTGYMVQVGKDRRTVFRKTFTALEDAIAARDAALQKYHGEYAYQSNQKE